MATTIQIDLRYFDAYYFDDPGLVPGTPPTGYTLKPEVEQWIRNNGGCEGWGMADVEVKPDMWELVVEVTFSVDETAKRFARQFTLSHFA